MPKRILQGTVVSNKAMKTVVVKVERRFRHPVVRKTVRTSKKYKAHDEGNLCNMGDIVLIQESRPISRHKHWVVLSSERKLLVGVKDLSSENHNEGRDHDSNAD